MKSTKSLGLAASWLALGAKYEKTDKTDRKHMTFYFSPVGIGETGELKDIPKIDLDQIEKDWANGCVLGNFVEYEKALQRLKAIIHSD